MKPDPRPHAPRHERKGLATGHIWLILGLALFVRALCFLPGAREPQRFFTDDSRGYTGLAADLQAGYLDPHSTSFKVGLVRTPAYPVFLGAFLGLFRGSFPGVLVIQIGISVFTVWLTSVLALRLVDRRTALLGGLLLALDPVSALFSCLLQPETLFTALVLGATLAWLQAVERGTWKPAAGAGLLLGLATLTRPIGLFLPLFLAPAAWLSGNTRGRTRILLFLLLGTSLPVGGWMAKNWTLTGFPVLSIGADSSLLDYRAAGALAEDEGISREEARARIWPRLMAISPPAASAVELAVRERRLALQILAEHPIGAVKMMFHAVVRMMAGTGLTALSNLVGDADPEGVEKPWKRALQGLAVLALGVVYLAVARSVVLLAARRDFLSLALTLGVIVYFVLISAGPEANTRFRFPASPFLAILAGHGLSPLFSRLRPS